MEAVVAAIITTVGAIIAAVIGIKKNTKSANNESEENQEKYSTSQNETNNSSNVAENGISISGDNNQINIGSQDRMERTKAVTKIILKEKYTSVYMENGSLQSERIIIEHTDSASDRIEGMVILNDKYKYKLKGSFNNKILTGEYYSQNNHEDERGTINLKMISEDIFSGFCSFSKVSSSIDDQIRVSPYVWVAGENRDLINGTYEFCNECHTNERKCCCESDEVDMPILINDEPNNIQGKSPRVNKLKHFSTQIGKTSVRQMNRRDNGECHFFCNGSCKIYEDRPIDCRLFPFDIKLDKETGEYWIGYYSEICEKGLPDKEEMKKYVHILRPYFFLLYPFANIITDDTVCERLNKATFTKLYNAREFIF